MVIVLHDCMYVVVSVVVVAFSAIVCCYTRTLAQHHTEAPTRCHRCCPFPTPKRSTHSLPSVHSRLMRLRCEEPTSWLVWSWNRKVSHWTNPPASPLVCQRGAGAAGASARRGGQRQGTAASLLKPASPYCCGVWSRRFEGTCTQKTGAAYNTVFLEGLLIDTG